MKHEVENELSEAQSNVRDAFDASLQTGSREPEPAPVTTRANRWRRVPGVVAELPTMSQAEFAMALESLHFAGHAF